jgi:hypothetical protein
MAKIICLECHKEFNNDTGLHKHLRSHKITQVVYYQKHFPRYDKHDGNFIRFKNKEYYFNTDFNTKTNLKLWLEKVSKDEAKTYLRNYLAKRKERKNLIYAPTQVELRSLPVPGMRYFNDLFGSYYGLCDSMGLKIRHSKFDFYLPPKDISKCHIVSDTREQMPLKFKLKTKSEALKFGDYKLSNENFTCDCYIERKTLGDFYGTLTGGIERFTREVFRAHEAGAYLIVLIESNFESVQTFRFQRQVYGKVSISPEFVFHGMRELLQTYQNLQFLFVNNRDEASRVIEKIFASNCEYKEVDLQYAYDTGVL